MRKLARGTIVFVLALATFTSAIAGPDDETGVSYDDKTVTHDCDKQGRGVNLNNKVTITLVGRCTNLIIAGTKNKVTGDVRRVGISGGSNIVDVQNVETIIVTGNDNKVTFKGSFHPAKQTSVSSSGKRNTIASAPAPKRK